METLKFGELPNSCEPIEKECKSKSEYCITTKKVEKITYMGEISANGKGT
jgi:hypothetical protein